VATVIVRLVVEQFGRWQAEYEAMHRTREGCGERGRQLFRDSEDPHVVLVVFDWDSHDNARAYFSSDTLKASVERAHGRSAPEVWYVDSIPPQA